MWIFTFHFIELVDWCPFSWRQIYNSSALEIQVLVEYIHYIILANKIFLVRLSIFVWMWTILLPLVLSYGRNITTSQNKMEIITHVYRKHIDFSLSRYGWRLVIFCWSLNQIISLVGFLNCESYFVRFLNFEHDYIRLVKV